MTDDRTPAQREAINEIVADTLVLESKMERWRERTPSSLSRETLDDMIRVVQRLRSQVCKFPLPPAPGPVLDAASPPSETPPPSSLGGAFSRASAAR